MRPLATVSGRTIDYANPEASQIDIEDLLAHIGAVIRYAGARRVSVLVHTALATELARCVYRYAPADIALVACHDLHEGIVLDLPTQLKAVLPDYRALEHRFEALVHRLAKLPAPAEQTLHQIQRVKAIDNRALIVEMELFHHPSLQGVRDDLGAALPAELAVGRRILAASERDLCTMVRLGLCGAAG